MFCFLNKLARSFQFFLLQLIYWDIEIWKRAVQKMTSETHCLPFCVDSTHRSLCLLWVPLTVFLSPPQQPATRPLKAPEAVAGGLLLLSPVEGQKPISCNTSDFCWSSQSRGFRGERPCLGRNWGQESLTPSSHGEGQSDNGIPCVSNSYLAP